MCKGTMPRKTLLCVLQGIVPFAHLESGHSQSASLRSNFNISRVF